MATTERGFRERNSGARRERRSRGRREGDNVSKGRREFRYLFVSKMRKKKQKPKPTRAYVVSCVCGCPSENLEHYIEYSLIYFKPSSMSSDWSIIC